MSTFTNKPYDDDQQLNHSQWHGKHPQFDGYICQPSHFDLANIYCILLEPKVILGMKYGSYLFSNCIGVKLVFAKDWCPTVVCFPSLNVIWMKLLVVQAAMTLFI